ncbi:hypothetical protein ACIQCG_01215 [Streptomyces noursei]|uniref:hypothetical protein n=1 Tax=Streptomyces noursei TaxID=1971 RepID=UPI003807ED91
MHARPGESRFPPGWAAGKVHTVNTSPAAQAAALLTSLRTEHIPAGLLQATVLLLEAHGQSCRDEQLLAATRTALGMLREVITPLPQPRARQSPGGFLEPG